MKPVALDRTTMADVKRVGLPSTGFPNAPTIDVINGVGKQFGLVGLVTTAIVQSNRSSEVTSLMAAKGFDPHAYFEAEVADRMRNRGLAVLPLAADGKRQDFLTSYPSATVDDAVLDVFVSGYGFFAFSDADDSPYRPAVSLAMRLVNARDRSILMQDRLVNTGLEAPVAGAPSATPPSFTTFSGVTDNPDLAIIALSNALAYAADAVGTRLA